MIYGPVLLVLVFETLADLDRSLSSRKYGSKLLVIRGDPTQIFPKLLKSLKVTDLYFESDTEPSSSQKIIPALALSALRPLLQLPDLTFHQSSAKDRFSSMA